MFSEKKEKEYYQHPQEEGRGTIVSSSTSGYALSKVNGLGQHGNEDAFGFGDLACLQGLSPDEVTAVLTLAINNLHAAMKEQKIGDGGGTTLSGVVTLPRADGSTSIVSFNVGDSFTYLLRNGDLERLTVDHDGHNLQERARLEKAKTPFVIKQTRGNVLRLPESGLMISRSLGNFESEKYGCIHAPECKVVHVKKGDESVALLTASDGLGFTLVGQYSAQKQHAMLEREKNKMRDGLRFKIDGSLCLESTAHTLVRSSVRAHPKKQKTLLFDDASVVVRPLSRHKIECQYVADGHGVDGKKASTFVRDNLFSYINTAKLAFDNRKKHALSDAPGPSFKRQRLISPSQKAPSNSSTDTVVLTPLSEQELPGNGVSFHAPKGSTSLRQ